MITLRISQEARKAISLVTAREKGMIPALVWTKNGGKDGSWVFGFSSRDRIPSDEIVVLSGLELAISGPPQYLALLTEKVLHYFDSEYVLTDD